MYVACIGTLIGGNWQKVRFVEVFSQPNFSSISTSCISSMKVSLDSFIFSESGSNISCTLIRRPDNLIFSINAEINGNDICGKPLKTISSFCRKFENADHKT